MKRTTERERAAFLLGIEFAAESLESLTRESRMDGYMKSHKALLLELIDDLEPTLSVSRNAMSEIDLDLIAARKRIDV